MVFKTMNLATSTFGDSSINFNFEYFSRFSCFASSACFITLSFYCIQNLQSLGKLSCRRRFGLEKLIDGWSLRQTNTRLKRCVSGSVIRVIAPHPLLPFPPSFFLLLRPKMLLSSSYATSYLIRRNYTWCLLGFDLILSSTLYVNGDCNSETLFRKQLMMI